MSYRQCWVKLVLRVCRANRRDCRLHSKRFIQWNCPQRSSCRFPLPDTQVEYAYQEAEDKDWNEEWEKNFFQPIIIGDRCVIHSTFHRDIPQAEYDIVINPQMAFGTGHHETTSLIIGELLDNDLQGKSLLDMGCGTSILAILARMRGAAPCTAVDIDECAYATLLKTLS